IVPADLTDNACINVYKLTNEYYASSETCNIWRICPKTLNVMKKINLDKIMGVNLACSHVQYMSNENYAYNLSSSFLTGMKYHLIKIPLFHYDDDDDDNNKTLLEQSKILTTIGSRWTTCIAYYHSFGITENFIIFIELPLLVNGFKLATCTPKGRPLKDCFEWQPNERAKFYVISKQNGRILQRYYSEPFFYFHMINSYEDNGHIVTDIMAYKNATILDKWDLHQMRKNIYDDNNQAVPTRFVMPIITDYNDVKIGENLVTLANTDATAILMEKDLIMLTGESLCKPGFELPTINYRHFNGHKYKYCYGSGIFEQGNFSRSICKLNVEDKTVIIWKDTDDFFPGECIFIARPGSDDEDDGIILSLVLSGNELLSHYLLILDARTFTEIARAEIATGTGIIPPTIHGVFDYVVDE
ncbi:Retinal pigment epithelial membrane protein-like protein, partial [Euroglyphus maynei]